jgi:hypothetical protein
MDTVYKVVSIDGCGRLNSLVAEGAWSHRYELDQLTVPRDTNSWLFAYRTFEDALVYRLAQPVDRHVYVYQALTSSCIGIPPGTPILADEACWPEYWRWFQRGMPGHLREPAWNLYQTQGGFVLCKDITLIQAIQ